MKPKQSKTNTEQKSILHYNWDAMYVVIKASSDRIVAAAVKRFTESPHDNVETGTSHD